MIQSPAALTPRDEGFSGGPFDQLGSSNMVVLLAFGTAEVIKQ